MNEEHRTRSDPNRSEGLSGNLGIDRQQIVSEGGEMAADPSQSCDGLEWKQLPDQLSHRRKITASTMHTNFRH